MPVCVGPTPLRCESKSNIGQSAPATLAALPDGGEPAPIVDVPDPLPPQAAIASVHASSNPGRPRAMAEC